MCPIAGAGRCKSKRLYIFIIKRTEEVHHSKTAVGQVLFQYNGRYEYEAGDQEQDQRG